MAARTRSCRKGIPPGCAGLFLLLFGLAGVLTLFLLGRDLLREHEVGRSWARAEARLLDKQIITSRSSDSTTHRPEFTFTYDYQGRTYTATGYKRFRYSSSGKWAQRVLARYRVGDTVQIWVNPSNPAEAVIEQGVGIVWLFLLIPAVFIAVGIGGVYLLVRGDTGKRRRAKPSASQPVAGQPACFPSLRVRKGRRLAVALTPSSGQRARVIMAFVVALLWNGFVWPFFILMLREKEKFGAIVLAIFCLAGLAILGGFVHQLFYWLLTGDPHVEIEHEPLVPGRPTRLVVVHPGVQRLNTASVSLCCEEVTRRRQGKNTSERRERVVEEQLAILTEPDLSRSTGLLVETSLRVPEDAMHSFTATNNHIRWLIEVVMDIPGKPDVKLDFPVRVAPR